MGWFRLFLIPCLPWLFSGTAQASAGDLCLAAARDAAATTGVPYDVLVALSWTETGRERDGRTEPWPWTIHDNGQGHWFDSQAMAEAYATEALAAGRTNIDVGCFQLNYRWHGGLFASLSAMLSPQDNALYAAEFLASHYAESGDWSVAAGAYHSQTEEFAARYRARFDAYLAMAGADGAQPTAASVNSYPLLQPSTGPRAPGSLVPLNL